MSDGPARHLLPRRIGIHGVRSAGKTCFLGSLYGFRAGEAASVDFADDATCHYLAGIWKDLSEARVPGATLLAMPTDLRMDILHAGEEGLATPLLLCDYAGLLVEPKGETASPAAHTLSAGVKAWFRSCHAVLVFLDSSRPDLEQLDALDLLLTELRRPGPDGPALERPLAIVLTKWDSQGTISNDLAREQARARDFLRTNHAFRQISQKLDAAQVKVFPVSSFGNHARGTQPPDLARYHPCHLHAPLAWAAEVSDLVLLEEAREAASRHLDRGWHLLGVNVWPQPDHAAARQSWLDLQLQASPGHGHLAEVIEEELAALGAKTRQHWLGYLAAIAGALALVVLGINQAARYADGQADSVVRFSRAHDGPEDAGGRVAKADEFLSSWLSYLVPRRRQEVAQQREADVAVRAELSEREAVKERFAEAVSEKDWLKAHDVVAAFVEKYPLSPIREELGTRWQAIKEEAGWLKARGQARRQEEESDFEGALAACAAFEREFPKSRHLDEVRALVRDLKESQTDQGAYEVIRRFARKGEPAALEEAARLAGEYVKSRKLKGAMRPEAERFWDWFQQLQAHEEHYVSVESVSVPGSSVMVPVAGTARLRVHLTINGKEHETGDLRGLNLTPDAKLGPFTVKWGKTGTLVLRVSSRLFVRTAWAKVEEEDPLFILGKANGALTLKDENGKEVRVVLRCPGAVPPDLPPYRNRRG
jgi:hypothetical protein